MPLENSKPISFLTISDLADLMDRSQRLEKIVDRLEDSVSRIEKVLEGFIELYNTERVKNWELILKELVERKTAKYGNRNR